MMSRDMRTRRREQNSHGFSWMSSRICKTLVENHVSVVECYIRDDIIIVHNLTI